MPTPDPSTGILVLRNALVRGVPPSPEWIDHWSARGEPVAMAWDACESPNAMVHLLELIRDPRAAAARAVSAGGAGRIRTVVPVPPDLRTLCGILGVPLPSSESNLPVVVRETSAALAEPGAFSEGVKKFIAASRGKNSKRAFEADIAHYRNWCVDTNRTPFPAGIDTLIEYFAALGNGTAPPTTHVHYNPDGSVHRTTHKPRDEEGWRLSSIKRKRSSIGRLHRLAGVDDPTRDERVTTVIKGIAATRGSLREKKDAMLPEHLREALTSEEDDLTAALERAVMLLGFALSARRSEIVGLNVADVAWTAEGLRVTIRWSKRDQEGEGAVLGVVRGEGTTCPVTALRKWLDVSGIQSGALFRSVQRGKLHEKRLGGDAVARMVKKWAERAGLDPTRFGGHSLRAGFITAAARADVPEHAIMRQSRHKSRDMLGEYIREVELWARNPGKGLL